MDLVDVMDQVAERLRTISGLHVFAWPPGQVVPPAAIVSYPDGITFDAAYRRGKDKMALPVVVVVGRVVDRVARDQIGAYCAGSGPRSVKQVLEDGVGAGAYTAFDTLRVTGVDFDTVTIAGVDYMAALFTLDISGKGTA